MKNKAQPIHAPSAVAFLLFIQVFISLLAGTLGGGIGRITYMLSYLIPVVLFAFLAQKQGIPCAAFPTRAGLIRALPLLPIFMVSVILTASATSAAMDLLGIDAVGGAAEGAGFFSDLFTDCVFPAVLEEGLMRFAVLSLLLLWHDRHAIWVSAVLFALLHASLYQIPYAFVGGLFLALATVWGGSPLWAILFHFVSNLFSLLMQYTMVWFGRTTGIIVSLSLCAVLFLFAAWGCIVLLGRRKITGEVKVKANWRSLLLSPLSLWALMMMVLTVL